MLAVGTDHHVELTRRHGAREGTKRHVIVRRPSDRTAKECPGVDRVPRRATPGCA